MFYKKYTRTLNPIKQQFFYYFFKDTKNIEKDSWVADIASYNGMNADIFKNQNYVAVDKDLEILKKIVNQKYKVRADILRLPFLTGSFDAVVSTHTLSHLKFKERLEGIKELGRLVRPGGTFIFNIPLSDDNGQTIKLSVFRDIIKDDFEIRRVVSHGGLLTKFYNSVITEKFRKKDKSSLFLSRLYMLATLSVSFFEFFTGLSRLNSYKAYFYLIKKDSRDNKVNGFGDFFSRLACPIDKSELIRSADGKFRGKSCAHNFSEQDGIVNLLV